MKKYKVEITKTYTLDVLAENEKEATDKAEADLTGLEAKDQQHYNQTGDTDFIVYDVTDTDDSFNPHCISFCNSFFNLSMLLLIS